MKRVFLGTATALYFASSAACQLVGATGERQEAGGAGGRGRRAGGGCRAVGAGLRGKRAPAPRAADEIAPSAR
eukprot:3796036-Prymnesium_polylepis.1